MRSYELLLAFAASAAAAPAGLFNRAPAVCNADNCLRAIRNTARPGLADCSSFLAATVTPATSTVTDTLTFSTTPTLTFEVTDTFTNLATATEVVEQTTTETVTNTVTVHAGITLRKRQATVIPSDIPRYATACSGTVRYTSACACLGAGSATTITVAAPTTTVTVSETVTPTIISEYITVQTDQVTVTDATVTNTVVVETVTATVDTTTTLPAPTILNSGFDDTVAGPWTYQGTSRNNDQVFPKRSQPNILLIRSGGRVWQTIDNLLPSQRYRIVFYWSKFDTPPAANGCSINTFLGNEAIGQIPLLPPRSDNAWHKFVSADFQPSATSLTMIIGISCTSGSPSQRNLIDDVSIEIVA